MRGTRGAGATWAARCLAGGVAEADLAQLVGSPPGALSRGVHPLKCLELVCPQWPAAAPGRSPRRCCCGSGRTPPHRRSTAAREQVEAAELLAKADRIHRTEDATAEHERAATRAAGEDLYDTVGRRQELAASLDGVASTEAIQARVLVDAAQGRPAH